MKSDMDYFNLIDDYLSGKLNKTLVKSFEQEMKTNSALKNQVKLKKDMDTLLKEDAEESAFRANLRKIGNKFKSDEGHCS